MLAPSDGPADPRQGGPETTAAGAEVYHTRSRGGVEIVAVRLVPAGRVVVERCVEILSEPERRRADRFAHERDRRRFVLARARLRQLLGARLGLPPRAVELRRGSRGKPFVPAPTNRARVAFSVSRSEDVAVYAFATAVEVGVDVEAVRAVPGLESVVARFFSPGERREYEEAEPWRRPLAFFRAWTRKEALAKALGDGLVETPDPLEVPPAPWAPPRVAGEPTGWRLESFGPAAGYVGAVASASLDEPSTYPAA